MKIAVYILKAAIPILLLSLGLYWLFFCVSAEGIDPIEVETIGMSIFTILGIALSLFLMRKAGRIKAVIFWPSFLLYVLTFALPALVYSVILILFMTAG